MSDNKLLAWYIAAALLIAIAVVLGPVIQANQVSKAKQKHLAEHQAKFDPQCEFCDCIQRYLAEKKVGKK